MKISVELFRQIILDAVFLCVAILLSFFLRFEGNINNHYFIIAVYYIPVAAVIQLTVFWLFEIYYISWRYASIIDALKIFLAVVSSVIILFLVQYINNAILPVSIYFVLSFLLTVFIAGMRYWWRISASLKYRYSARKRNIVNRILIIGAGEAGAMLVREINNHRDSSIKIVGFIDDDPQKIGKQVLGVKVFGGRDVIYDVCKKHQVTDIHIALPSANGSVIKEISEICRKVGAKVKTLPSLFDIAGGKVTVNALRNISIEDLLQREPLTVGGCEVLQFYSGKRVMVTGAGGSIGSELCRQLAGEGVQLLLLVGKGENSIFLIEQELRQKYPTLNYRALIGDVRDEHTMEKIFSKYKPQVVFHAAAHKHVPLMEHQPDEAINNNVVGTCNVARIAAKYGAEQFVLVSTDKAVNPTNIMGASKRVAELVVKTMNNICPKTAFCAVRFGNVLGSRGSVVPTFRAQIERGGPVTVTHPDMKRYFMTIPEACRLVIRAGTLTDGGEVFLLNMGEPVRILDLALDMIKLSGLMPYEDIDINFSGLRPGEKLFEELWKENDPDVEVIDNTLFILKEQFDEKWLKILDEVHFVYNRDEAMAFLKKWVPEYKMQRNGKNKLG